MTAKVCHQMAEHAVLRQRNYDAAIQYYKEALTFNEDDEVIGSKYYISFHSTQVIRYMYLSIFSFRLPCAHLLDYIS